MQDNNDQFILGTPGLNPTPGTNQSNCDKQFAQDVIEYQRRVDEIILWLFEKEKELLARPQDLEQLDFDDLLNEYSSHERFLTDFYNYGAYIMTCKEDGIELRDNHLLIQEDRDEVGIQADKMNVCYEKFKILSSDRLNALKRVIEERQSKKIEQFEEWLLSIEKKIYSNNNIGLDCNTIQRQLLEMDHFREVLEQKQHHLEFMSNVIVFDDLDTDQTFERSYDDLNQKLEEINSRWEAICKFVNDRTSDLQCAKITWDLLEEERPKLLDWLKTIEDNISVLSDAATNASNEPTVDELNIKKLTSRADKIDENIKRIQILYTSLEQRTRDAINSINDKCSMFLIELEKALEDIRENWNSMIHSKRMLDFKLNSLSQSGNNVLFKEPSIIEGLSNHHVETATSTTNGTHHNQTTFNNSTSSSSNDDDRGSSYQVYSSISGPITFGDTSPSSRFEFERAADLEIESDQDDENHDELSTTFSLTENSQTNSGINIHKAIQQQQYNNFDTHHNINHNQHNCRVEEWRQTLDSFSNWLKRIETSLGIDETIVDLNNDSSIQCWSQCDSHQQLQNILDIEKQIHTGSQLEFDNLITQGQQIISDLIPEIDGNAYEANLKEIISDIELRFNLVKHCLENRKVELLDKARWIDLCKKLKSSSGILIDEMSKIIPESDIGVDLITLAQQQDQLIRSKSQLDDNIIVQSSIQDSHLFLKMCDTIQQLSINTIHNQYQPDDNNLTTTNLNDIWLSLKDIKGDIETQLDNLKLHYSELSQLIDDRLERLDEVHKEMHALQHSIQELSRQLQLAEILRSNWNQLDDLPIESLSEQLEELKLFRERISDIATTHEVMNSIVDWMTQSDVPLSQQNLKRISELNTIWSLIQVSVEDRQRAIELAFDNLGATEQKFLNITLQDLPNWERRVTASKVPYFTDTSNNKTIWDHPKFSDMLTSLNSVQQVVFSAYRTALKLRIVQKTLGIDLIMLENLKEIFASFNFSANSNAVANSQSRTSVSTSYQNDSLIDVEMIIMVLKVIYEKIQAEERPELDVPLSIDLTLNWLLNLYDSSRTGYLSALSLKVGLAILCCATREEKYVFMYDLIANSQTQGVDGRRLGTLFEICMRIPIYLGEGKSFGGTEIIESNIRDCFSKSKFNPYQPNCIDRDDYCNWLKSEPQFIIWLPVLHRLLVSENIRHPIKCKICKAQPMIGLRYRCLRCFNYNICQNCFLTGLHINDHFNPKTHPMQEYCCSTGSTSSKVRDFGKILKNKLKPSR